jgi:hypothetical protein
MTPWVGGYALGIPDLIFSHFLNHFVSQFESGALFGRVQQQMFSRNILPNTVQYINITSFVRSVCTCVWGLKKMPLRGRKVLTEVTLMLPASCLYTSASLRGPTSL